jgi:hypothetical protein
MTPQPTTSSTTQARNGRRSGALRAGTRAARGARVRRRALVAALGLAVLAAVVPVTAAPADPQRIDVGFGEVATGSHQAAGVALIAAVILLGRLVVVIARRQRAEAGSSR